MGNDSPQFSIFRHGRRSCAATCQIAREDGAIIDICMVVFGSVALFSLHARGRHSDSTPDSRRVRMCSRLPCGSYGAGSPTAVAASWLVVGTGELYAVVEWIPAAM